MVEAGLYSIEEKNIVRCNLCGHACRIQPDGVGVCGVRFNNEGRLYTTTYGAVIAQNKDPVEKKPLYHFLPGTFAYSIAAAGCNFKCAFCQNWEISQIKEFNHSGYEHKTLYTPKKIVENALAQGCKSIAFTYTEPTLSIEFIKDIGALALPEGLKCVMISNGFMSREAITELAPFIAAYNIDLKSFSDSFYRKYCNGRLEPVLDSIKTISGSGAWIEITTLLIPHLNDSADELTGIGSFLASIDRAIPWHISRFFPRYKMQSVEITSTASIKNAVEIAKKFSLQNIYTGNCDDESSTCCSHCGNILISRKGYTIKKCINNDGTCPRCGTAEKGIWR